MRKPDQSATAFVSLITSQVLRKPKRHQICDVFDCYDIAKHDTSVIVIIFKFNEGQTGCRLEVMQLW